MLVVFIVVVVKNKQKKQIMSKCVLKMLKSDKYVLKSCNRKQQQLKVNLNLRSGPLVNFLNKIDLSNLRDKVSKYNTHNMTSVSVRNVVFFLQR